MGRLHRLEADGERILCGNVQNKEAGVSLDIGASVLKLLATTAMTGCVNIDSF